MAFSHICCVTELQIDNFTSNRRLVFERIFLPSAMPRVQGIVEYHVRSYAVGVCIPHLGLELAIKSIEAAEATPLKTNSAIKLFSFLYVFEIVAFFIVSIKLRQHHDCCSLYRIRFLSAMSGQKNKKSFSNRQLPRAACHENARKHTLGLPLVRV